MLGAESKELGRRVRARNNHRGSSAGAVGQDDPRDQRARPAGAQDTGRFAGALVLVEQESGKVLAMSLWESEQAMNATEEVSYWLRVFSAEVAGGVVRVVERYEVGLFEVQS